MISALTTAERDRLKTLIANSLSAAACDPEDGRLYKLQDGDDHWSANGNLISNTPPGQPVGYYDRAFAADDLAERLTDAIAGPLLVRIAELEELLRTLTGDYEGVPPVGEPHYFFERDGIEYRLRREAKVQVWK